MSFRLSSAALLATFGALLAVLSGCDKKCNSPLDCQTGEQCLEQKCVARTPPPHPTGTPDAGRIVLDALPDLDAPDLSDTMVAPQPDATSPLPDSGTDGGILDGSLGPITVSDARMRIYDFDTEALLDAQLLDFAGTTVISSSVGFAPVNLSDVRCSLLHTKLMSGAPRGLAATKMTLGSFVTPPTSIDLLPVPAQPGVFAPAMLPFFGYLGRLSAADNTLALNVVSTGAQGSVADAMITVHVPDRIAVQLPRPASQLLAAVPLLVSWTPLGPGSRRVVLELSDAGEEHVLRCQAAPEPGGMLTLPPGAQDAWVASGLVAPARMRISYQETTLAVLHPVSALSQTINFSIVVERGSSYQVLLP